MLNEQDTLGRIKTCLEIVNSKGENYELQCRSVHLQFRSAISTWNDYSMWWQISDFWV